MSVIKAMMPKRWGRQHPDGPANYKLLENGVTQMTLELTPEGRRYLTCALRPEVTIEPVKYCVACRDGELQCVCR